MKNLVSVNRNYYRNNGLLGLGLKKLVQTRGGADHFNFRGIQDSEIVTEDLLKELETFRVAKRIDEILNDDQIPEEQKRPFRVIREELRFGDSEKIKLE